MNKPLSENMQNFLNYCNTPWGRLFYRLALAMPGELKDRTILDFGSGFGTTADALAANNAVIAIEPNVEMVEHRFQTNTYTQICGGIEWLKNEPEGKYDVIICHNVLEYAANREEILHEFARVLKDDGFISIIKHNRIGKIMQKAVFEYKPEEVMTLLNGDDTSSQSFGTIHEYENHWLEAWSGNSLKISKTSGLRVFYGLQRNELKTDPDWENTMFELEMKAADVPELKEVAFFQHVVLKKYKEKIS